MTQNDFEKALAALKALTHNDDETPMMIDMACWLIDHLDEVTAALQAAIAKPVGVDYIRRDIVPQDQVMKVLSGLDGLMGATFWNTNDAKHEWAEWANKNRDILRTLLVAHGGDK